MQIHACRRQSKTRRVNPIMIVSLPPSDLFDFLYRLTFFLKLQNGSCLIDYVLCYVCACLHTQSMYSHFGTCFSSDRSVCTSVVQKPLFIRVAMAGELTEREYPCTPDGHRKLLAKANFYRRNMKYAFACFFDEVRRSHTEWGQVRAASQAVDDAAAAGSSDT